MLEVSDLIVERAGHRILNSVTFSVKENERVAIVGANGSGKSTLIRCILGLCKYKGNIFVGSSIIGYVPQKSVIPSDISFSVREFLVSALSSSPLLFAIKKDIEEKLHEYLGIFSFDKSILDSRIGRLSGGETMKVLLLRAIISKPELLILDEPEQSLDREGRSILISALNAHPTCLIISHDDELISKVCNRKLILENGNIFKS